MRKTFTIGTAILVGALAVWGVAVLAVQGDLAKMREAEKRAVEAARRNAEALEAEHRATMERLGTKLRR